MLVFLSQNTLWWYWIAIGLILLIVEMLTGTFLILGLGISAIFVGIIDMIMHTSITINILLWIMLSTISLFAWKKWVKEKHVSDSGQSNFNLNTLGTVTQTILPHKKGKVTFDIPILGHTTLTAIANNQITKGTRVKIVNVYGQLVEVQSI